MLSAIRFASPTLAEDLADACVQAALKRATGIYHVSGSETISILDMVNRTADFSVDKNIFIPSLRLNSINLQNVLTNRF